MKLLVGLGNHPAKYNRIRHNFGFLVIEKLVEQYSIEPLKLEKKFFGEVASGQIENEKVVFLKPHTYMNLSGKAVQAVAHFYKIPPQDIVVFFDDVDLPFGTVRFREGGSSGGHNGIKSITGSLGTKDFPRIKLGIANEEKERMPTEAFVLKKFSDTEWGDVPNIVTSAIKKFHEKIPC